MYESIERVYNKGQNRTKFHVAIDGALQYVPERYQDIILASVMRAVEINNEFFIDVYLK